MKYDFQYQSGAHYFEADFGRVIDATDGGFERGYAAGYTEGEQTAKAAAEAANAVILADCNEVLPTKGASTAETLEQVPKRIGEIVVEEDYLKNAYSVRIVDLNSFGKADVIANLNCLGSAMESFSNNGAPAQYGRENTTVKHLTVNCPNKVVDAYRMFFFANSPRDKTLEHLTLNVDFSNASRIGHFLGYADALKIVDGKPLDFSANASAIYFPYLGALEEIRFAKNSIKASLDIKHSSNLSADSIQSIIDGLTEVATAQTLTLQNTVGNKLTKAQKDAISAKNWTLVY